MLESINAVKEFILSTVNDKISEVEDLPEIDEDNVVIGAIDVDKKKAEVLVSIIPTSQQIADDEDWDLDSFEVETRLTVSFLTMKALQSVLDERALTYAEIFRNAVIEDIELKDTVNNTQINSINPYLDCGNLSGQMSCVEIEITINRDITI